MSSIRLPKLNTKTQKLNYDTKNLNDLAENKQDYNIIYEAIQVGYLLYPSKEFIWSIFQQQSDYVLEKNQIKVRKYNKYTKSYFTEIYENDYSKILFLNLCKAPIIEIGDLVFCKNLVILNLSSNYLINIEPLIACRNLLRLDLQNNLINKLPDDDFWSSMTKLKILFLHNNTIGRLEYLKNLSFCPRLEVLTLYDSPISLKNNYRHHAVNSILTLKALDNYVISDEEIIEEASFDNKFSARTANFLIDLAIPPAQDNSFASELKATRELLKKVNYILSKNSPVLIIQKYIKRFLAQKQYAKYKIEKKTAAIIKIQKWWRKNKKNSNLKKKSKYIKALNERKAFNYIQDRFNSFIETNQRNNTPISTGQKSIKENFLIDLNKLTKRQSSFLENLPKVSIENSVSSKDQLSNSATKSRQDLILTLFKDKRLDSEKLITISKMLTNFNHSLDRSQFSKDIDFSLISQIIKEILEKKTKQDQIEKETDEKLDEEEEQQNSNLFRLPSLKPDNSIIKSKENYVVDLVREKIIGVSTIKKMEADGHSKLNSLKSKIDLKQHNFLTNDQRFFQKIYGNMSLGCLIAVDKAYEERGLIDQANIRQKLCDKLKENRKVSQRQVNYLKEDRIKEIRSEINKDKNVLKTNKLKSETEFLELKERVKEKRERLLEFKKKRKKDILLAIDFSKQHLSVSKALQRHEFLSNREKFLKIKSNFVMDQKALLENQRDLIKNYIEQRINLRIVQSNNEKKIIKERLESDTQTELNRTKERVNYIKSMQPVKYKQLEIYNFDFETNELYDEADSYLYEKYLNLSFDKKNENTLNESLSNKVN